MMSISEPFRAWEMALQSDKADMLELSKSQFKEAAQAFFNLANRVSAGRALFEHSTLMDAFSSVQEARILRLESRYDDSMEAFSKASEILRATMHFGFLSGYVSGLASLETSLELEPCEDSFQGLKNAIALFEQSKLTLSFRDDKHPLLKMIDVLIAYSISKAFLVESKILADSGNETESRKKITQSEAVRGNTF